MVAEPRMSQAREEVLRRVRHGLRDVPATERPGDVAVERAYRTTIPEPVESLLGRFEERLRDYGAQVERVRAAEVGEGVGAACSRLGLERVVVPAGVPGSWRPAAVQVSEDTGLSAQELDRFDCVVTGCAVAIAETGTIALDGGPLSGRRVISLVPDNHICVVRADQVVGSVPEGVHALGPSVSEHRAPVTLISGPSASSDIELSRVEGVHGPRHLLVLIQDGTDGGTTDPAG
jgi:L-lactate dehydrogenase complex protein LldG